MPWVKVAQQQQTSEILGAQFFL